MHSNLKPYAPHSQYRPQLVIVSCGFDAALGDPLGKYCVTPTGYGHMTHLLTGLADGKVVIVLEVCDTLFCFHASALVITY